MRFVIFAVTMTALVQPAAASALDDYASCLIGTAAVALNQQTSGTVDPDKAKAYAYDHCKGLKAVDETGRLDGFVSKAVDALAKIASSPQ